MSFFFILQKALSVDLVGGEIKINKRKTCIVSVFGVTSKKGQCFNSGEMMGGKWVIRKTASSTKWLS